MEYGRIPGVALPVARLVQGSMMLGTEQLDESLRLLDAVFEAGGNTFDAAHIYGGGDCERVLGHWIKDRGVREQVVIVDKGAHFNADRNRVTPFDIAADLHDSLARLQTDYIDLYLLHRDDPAVPVGPIVEALNAHVEAGRIRAFGGSNWTHQRIEEANAYAAAHGLNPFVATSPHFSLAVQVEEPWPGCVSISGPGGADARAWYAQHGVAVCAWSSLSSGFLSGRYTRADIAAYPENAEELFVRCYRCEENLQRLDRAHRLASDKSCTVSQIALAYFFARQANSYALVGCVSGDEFRGNAGAFEVGLSQTELDWLDLRTP